MISCRRATELISAELDAELSLPQRVRLGFHSIVCTGCRRYRRQLRDMENAVEEFFACNHSDVLLPCASKARLKAEIDRLLKDES